MSRPISLPRTRPVVALHGALAAVLFVAGAAAAAQTIVNIDATHGFRYDGGGSDPAPVPGQHLNLIGAPVTLVLGAGDYRLSNADGMPGASFSAWSYNVGTSSWAWAFVIADAATSKAIGYYEAGGGSSAAQVAALPAVKNFQATLSLAVPTTLAFTLRDYHVPDNAGGISVLVSPLTAVPEPPAALLLALGLTGLAVLRHPRAH